MTYRCPTQRKHDPLGWEAWSELWGVYEWSIGVSWRDDDLLTSRGPPTNRCRGRCGTTEAALPTVRDLSCPPVGFKCVNPLRPKPV